MGGAVILVTGVMAAGKSTVAQLLAERFDRSVHVRGDVFRRFVVSGAVEPSPEMPPEAYAQLLLRYRIATAAADAYADAGFTAVVQDVVVGPVLADVVAMIRTRPRYVVVLDPDPAVVAEREAARPKTGYGPAWRPEDFVADLRSATPRIGLWLDTSDQDPSTTAAVVHGRLAEALVDDTVAPGDTSPNAATAS
ncbi:AAA family ATPase [Microlunatus spumicola]|uniref:AAA family ATPase n=1 Tax=Microlunatus spumicola TaxID=81499 RepID=UPI0031CE7D4F